MSPICLTEEVKVANLFDELHKAIDRDDVKAQAKLAGDIRQAELNFLARMADALEALVGGQP